MKFDFTFPGAGNVKASVIVCQHQRHSRDKMNFVIKEIIVGDRDIHNSDEPADMDLSDEITYSRIMSNALWDHLGWDE